MLGRKEVTQQAPLPGVPGGLAAAGLRLSLAWLPARRGGGEWRWVPPTIPTPGAREERLCRFRCGLGGTPQVTPVPYLSPTPGLIMALPGARALPSWFWR